MKQWPMIQNFRLRSTHCAERRLHQRWCVDGGAGINEANTFEARYPPRTRGKIKQKTEAAETDQKQNVIETAAEIKEEV